MRDLLLGIPNLDLDLVVEGDAIALARAAARSARRAVRSHRRFGTAKIILDGRRRGHPASLDFVTARTEFYERPTVLPVVERSSIKQDLYRRDFTINTLAICLDRGRFGELLDYYGGERDLQEAASACCTTSPLSRTPRASCARCALSSAWGSIEARTAELIEDALDLLDTVTGERLRHELYLLLEEAEPERALERLDYLGVLAHLHPSLIFTRGTATLFARLRQRLAASETDAVQAVESQASADPPRRTRCGPRCSAWATLRC